MRPGEGDGDGENDGSGSEHSDSEDENEHERQHNQWQPIEEDKTVPCEDELAYIAAKGEHSAVDHAYWEKETFFDLNDPELNAKESGRIDWLVERFNGTQDDPNMEVIMRSHTVRIGGYEWRIKFYPRGNSTDYLSAYIECVTMQEPNFEGSTDFANPPFPFLAGAEKPKQVRSIAVQLSLVMYNPAEPRVYEYQRDAHQFTKAVADYGWTRFTRYARREFSYRMHGQRQAILRDDKLAFSAYVRVIDDPTGCLWAHEMDSFDDNVALTGLRPFSPFAPLFSAELPLLHFAPFRDFIYRCKDTKIVFWFQTLLWKMISRKRSQHYGQGLSYTASDPVAWLRYAARWLRKETDQSIVSDLIGSLDPEQGAAICGNRLKTKNRDSIQAALDSHQTPLETPALLTLELERSEFDSEKRRWNKLTNKVDIQEKVSVAGTSYSLFAIATHCGDLQSNKFNLYIQPNGTGFGWYAYADGSVECLTRKQAVDKHCGSESSEPSTKSKRHGSSRYDYSRFQRWDDSKEVAHVVYYVRDDCAVSAFSKPLEETWNVPKAVRESKSSKQEQADQEPPPTAVAETFAAPDEEQLHRDREERRSSSGEVAGYATPNCWPMDGEDVVMSDVSDGSDYGANEKPEEDAPENKADEAHDIVSVTIDHLGREWYVGEVVNHSDGIYEGKGHLISMNGDEYIGSFKDGKKSGNGKMIYGSTGNIFEGSWLDDLAHGTGKLIEKKTGNIYEGSFQHGRKHGQFTLTGTVTEEDKGCCSICYDKEINTAFYDCGHVIACKECAMKIEMCPVCRKRVLARLELFGVRMTFE